MGLQYIQAFQKPHRSLARDPGRTTVTPCQCIALTNFQRAEVEFFRHHVEDGFHGRRHLGNAETPKSAGDGIVGVYRPDLQMGIGNPVGSPRMFESQRGHDAAQMVIRPCIKVDPGRQGSQNTVLRGPKSIIETGRMPFDARQKALFSTPPHLDRFSRAMEGGQAQQALHGDAVFTAEAPSAIGGDDADAIGRESERFRHFHAVAKGGLCGDGQFDPSLLIGDGPSVLRFQESMGLTGQFEARCQRCMAGVEGLFRIPMADLPGEKGVSALMVRMDDGGAFGKGLLRIEDGGKGFEIENDTFQGLFQGGRIFRHHQSNGVSTMADAVISQYRLIFADHSLTVFSGDIFGGKDDPHARHLQGAVCADTKDACVGYACPFSPGPKKAGTDAIDRIFLLSRDLGKRIGACHGLTHLVCAFILHGKLSRKGPAEVRSWLRAGQR